MPAVPVVEIMQPSPVNPGEQQYDPLAISEMHRRLENEQSGFVGIATLTLDNTRTIDEFRARLQGKVLKRRVNLETGEEMQPIEEKRGEPLMNNEGINHLVGALEFCLSRNITLSNIPKEREKMIRTLSETYARTMALQIALNSSKWSVDRNRRDNLPLEIEIMIYSNLMRAYDNGERRQIYPTNKHLVYGPNPNNQLPEKKPLLGF